MHTQIFLTMRNWSKKSLETIHLETISSVTSVIKCFSSSGPCQSLWPTSCSLPLQPVLRILPAWTRSWQFPEFLMPPPISYSSAAFRTQLSHCLPFSICPFSHKANPGIFCTCPAFSACFSMTLFCNQLFNCSSTIDEGSALYCLCSCAQHLVHSLPHRLCCLPEWMIDERESNCCPRSCSTTCYLCISHQRGADEQGPVNSTHPEDCRLRNQRIIPGLEVKFSGRAGYCSVLDIDKQTLPDKDDDKACLLF